MLDFFFNLGEDFVAISAAKRVGEQAVTGRIFLSLLPRAGISDSL